MSARTYTVIVYPPPPATRGDAATQTLGTPPRVITVTRAQSPDEAAERAGIQPGGRALVVVEARAFTRAEQAPLAEVGEDWQPLPQAATP